MGGVSGLRSAFLENAAKRQTARATEAIEVGSTVRSDQAGADREENRVCHPGGMPETYLAFA